MSTRQSKEEVFRAVEVILNSVTDDDILNFLRASTDEEKKMYLPLFREISSVSDLLADLMEAMLVVKESKV